MSKIFSIVFLAIFVESSQSNLNIIDIKKGLNTDVISKPCRSQIDGLPLDALIQMIDASSKIIYPGVLYTNPSDWGVYDECVQIDAAYPGGQILGKHCLGVNITIGLSAEELNEVKERHGLINLLNLNQNLTKASDKPSGLSLQEAICVPDACSMADIQNLYNSVASPNSIFSINFLNAKCSTKNTGKDLDNYDKAVISLLSVVLFLMIGSTAYDVYCEKMMSEKLQIGIAFSMYTNTKKLLHVSKGSKEQIQIFHGLKFISMMWIIAGHGFVAFLSIPTLNVIDLIEIQKARYIMYISSAPLAVDTFFYISGFLLPYTYLKQSKGKKLSKQTLNVPMLYIHRYLRLTPALGVIYLVTISVMRHLGDGPIWNSGVNAFAASCRKHAVAYFFYLQNYNNYNDLCLTQTWYVSADMQMFVISPLILIPTAYFITKNYKTVMMSLFGFVTFTIFFPMIIKFCYKDYDNSYDTHSRLCDYFIGFTFGTYMRQNLDKPFVLKKHVNILNIALWILSLVLMFVVCYIYNDIYIGHGTYTSQTIFFSFMRPIWCAGLSWIIYSSYHGYGGVVNWLLTRPSLQIGSRLSYCIYLTHGSVITHYVLQSRGKVYFGDFREFYLWCGYFIISLITSYIWTLAFESPMIIIEKIIFGKGKLFIPTDNNNKEQKTKI